MYQSQRGKQLPITCSGFSRFKCSFLKLNYYLHFYFLPESFCLSFYCVSYERAVKFLDVITDSRNLISSGH